MRLEDLQTDPTARYLGDGVYATFDGYQVVLLVSNGIEITNYIALEPSVFNALEVYYMEIKKCRNQSV